MTPSRRSTTKYHRPRDRREVVTAVVAGLAILVFTAVMVWVLGPHDGGSSTPSTPATATTTPISVPDTTPTSTPAGSTPAASTPADSSTPPASSG